MRTPRSPHRHRYLRSFAVAATLGASLIVPAIGHAASVSPWTPAPAGLVQTARTCPSPSVASYYNATCWTVSQDQTNPFYSADAPYPWSQCTYWALEMRPDLWNNQSASDPESNNWTAYTWAQHGALEGLTVDHTPSSGSVMVWPQTSSDQTGHVAYVQSVSFDPASSQDLITVQEMNDTTFDNPSLGQGDTMTLRMDPQDLTGVQFVHTPGYVASAIPVAAATGTTTSATPAPSTATAPSATAAVATRTPGLSLRFAARRLRVTSQSSAPLQATVTRLPSGKVVSHTRLRPGSTLRLPAGQYRVCVAQAGTGTWRSAKACTVLRRGRAAVASHGRKASFRVVRSFARSTSVAGLFGDQHR